MHSRMTAAMLAFVAAGFTALPAASAQAGSATSSDGRISQACVDPAFRQFDYWLGQWTVTGPRGNQAGTNHIIRVSDGCAILEQWRDATGVTGTSINFYNTATKKWEQHWMGGQGGSLMLAGGLHEGNMRLEGKRTTPNGPVIDRVTWIRMDGGKVRQHWEVSSDEGKSWQTVFDGLYASVR